MSPDLRPVWLVWGADDPDWPELIRASGPALAARKFWWRYAERPFECDLCVHSPLDGRVRVLGLVDEGEKPGVVCRRIYRPDRGPPPCPGQRLLFELQPSASE